MTDLALLSVAKRVTIVESVGTPDDGNSLAGQNVNNFPSGALFYVESSHRMYELRKNIDALVAEDGSFFNVVNGVGSSAVAGRFVAQQQFGHGALVAGSLSLDGFDLTNNGFFLVSYITPLGTQGFLHGQKVDANTAAVTSSSGSDTSTVLMVFVEVS